VTDFLSRLVERSTGRATVAHPVVLPLFAAGAPLGAEPVEKEAIDGTGSAEGPFATVGETSRPHLPASDAPTLHDTSAPASPVEERRTEVAVPGRERARGPANVGVGDRLRVRLVRDAASPMASEAAPLAASDAGEKATPAPVSSPDPVVELRPRDATVFPRTAVRVDASTSPPAPIVRISIGRVDVRAVPPALPAAPSPAPVRRDDRLSLEEYLRPRDRRR